MTHDYGELGQVAPSSDDLANLATMANELHLAMLEVEQAEASLKEKQAAVTKLSEVDLPELMDRIGMSEFTLKNGMKLQVEQKVRAGIKDANKDDAFQWLEKNNLSGAIKRSVEVFFNAGEESRAKALIELLGEKGYQQLLEEKWVEPPTLGKIVRDLIEQKVTFPRDLFGVYEFRKASLKESKKAKKATTGGDAVFGS